MMQNFTKICTTINNLFNNELIFNKTIFSKYNNILISTIKQQHLYNLHNQEYIQKIYKDLLQELEINYSLNIHINKEQHWKLSSTLDLDWRHNILRPNKHFDQHQIASLLRDSRDQTEALQRLQSFKQLNSGTTNSTETTTIEDNNSNNNNNENDINIDDSKEDTYTYSFASPAQHIKLNNSFQGTFYLNKNQVFFTPDNINNNIKHRLIEIKLKDLYMVLQRNQYHIPCGLEFFLTTQKSYLIIFPNQNIKETVIKILKKLKLPNLKYLQTSNSSLLEQEKITEKWVNGEISNYKYLIIINLFSGRSFNDLTQYPVFPWVLKDYTSETIDLNDPNVYRDLSKPIGALNEDRLEHLKELITEMDEENKFLYKVHYSNSYFVSYYLIRLEPFTSINIKMQDNKFDKSSRIFSSIPHLWESITSPDLTDYRELIPEFYSTPRFLINSDNFDLGIKSDGSKINDVILPPWSKNAYDFIEKHRAALESDYVSLNLPKWIDLIFGYKQNGKEAILANNTFHPYTYPTNMTKQVIEDPEKLILYQQFSKSFGTIPNQIFKNPHPMKINFSTINFILSLFTPTLQIEIKSKPIFLRTTFNNILIIITSLGKLILKNNKNENIFDISYCLTGFQGISERTISYHLKKNILIISTCNDCTFHMFQIDINNLTIKLINSQRQYSLINSLKVTSTNDFVTASRNYSIIKWNFTQPATMKFQISAHPATIIDFDIGIVSNALICGYKSRQISSFNFLNGSYQYSYSLDYNILMLKISASPCILICCEIIKNKILKIFSYGMDLNKIEELEIQSPKIQWCEMIIAHKDYVLAVSDLNNKLTLLSLPCLRILRTFELQDAVVTMYFDSRTNVLYYGTENNKVYSIDFH